MKVVIDRTFEFFSSLRLTIFLLIIILLYLAISTFIPQDTSYYKYLSENSPFLFLALRITGLTNPYHTLSLVIWLFLFTFNLIACTLNRLPAIFERTKRNRNSNYLPLESITKSDIILPVTEINSLRTIISNTGYKFIEIERDKVKYLVIKKGIYSPFNFILVHISILIIIAGIAISSIFGYEGYLQLSEEKREDHFFREVIRGSYIKVPLPFGIRLNKFTNVTIESGQSIDYISDVTIYNGTKTSASKIRVNEPLKYNGILFVQSSYEKNIDNARFKVELSDLEEKYKETKVLRIGEESEFAGKSIRITDYFENVHNMGEAIKVNYQDYDIIALKNRPDIQNDDSDIRVVLKEVNIPYDSILRVTYDPGTPIVFSGSFLFLLSLILILFYRFKMIVIKCSEKPEILYFGKRPETELKRIESKIKIDGDKK